MITINHLIHNTKIKAMEVDLADLEGQDTINNLRWDIHSRAHHHKADTTGPKADQAMDLTVDMDHQADMVEDQVTDLDMDRVMDLRDNMLIRDEAER
jgi:hypothetical protein